MLLGEEYFRQAVQTPRRHRRQPTRAFHYQAQTQGRMLLDALGIDGPITITSNACASGSCAVGHAWELIRRGRAGRVFVGGYDVLSEMVFSGFDALQALSPTVCRPFDARRDGLAIGEGAACWRSKRWTARGAGTRSSSAKSSATAQRLICIT